MRFTCASIAAIACILTATASHAQTACTETKPATVSGLNAEAGGLLNVRSGPGRGNPTVGQVRLGDVVQTCGSQEGWTEISYGVGSSGWVSSRFLNGGASPENAAARPAAKVKEVDRSNPWPDAYKRRDYQLGMTKSAFLATPYPDRDQYPKVYPICSDDPSIQRETFHPAQLFSEEFKHAGVITCSLLEPSESEFIKTPREAGLGLGDHVLQTSFYFINSDEDDTKRLFWVTTDGNQAYYPGLVPAFMKAYGDPTSDQTERWQNRMGATFDNRILSWTNGPSTIKLSQRTSKVDIFRAEYTLDALNQILERRLKEHSEAAADRL